MDVGAAIGGTVVLAKCGGTSALRKSYVSGPSRCEGLDRVSLELGYWRQSNGY